MSEKTVDAIEKILRVCFVLFLLVGIGACATAPSFQETATADYGNPPSGLEDTVTAHLKETLKDPGSLKNLRVGVARRGWTKANYGKDVLYGYWVGF